MEQQAEGYLGRAYIDALAQYGRALELPASQGWLLARSVPGQSDLLDACGAYPLFCCNDWNRLAQDLAILEGRLVSAVVVTDPFGDYTRADLDAAFPDLVRPFKEHITVELDAAPEQFVHAHHRYYARKALRDYRVALSDAPLSLVDRWNVLYDQLIRRHAIEGIAAFSPESFRRQFRIPGVRVFSAERDGSVEGMHIWFSQGDVAYHHLAAYSDIGYRSSVSYALMWFALQWFADEGIRRLDLGGGAGSEHKEDGLTRFKRGWSNATRDVFLCGRILDRTQYAQLAGKVSPLDGGYFPLYRSVNKRVAV